MAVAIVAMGLWFLAPNWPAFPPRWGRPAPGPGPGPGPPSSAEAYLFCTWNVENLFDDVDDPSNHDEDENWYARNPQVVALKVDRLAQALLIQNDGRGPDILVVVEVETRRAAEMLRQALNSRLSAADGYPTLVHRDNHTGRRIEPAVIARLPARDDLTRASHTDRILEAHLIGPGGAPLIVLASHWTSRVRAGTESRRFAYADHLYRDVSRRVSTDPSSDVLIVGDFNDEPNDRSVVEHLHAISDASLVTADGPLRLLNLAAGLDPSRGEGTYFYGGRWEVLDHIVASPGLLDRSGWSVTRGTLRVENPRSLCYGRDHRPWRFGGPTSTTPRGYSDHFALTVRLTVNAGVVGR